MWIIIGVIAVAIIASIIAIKMGTKTEGKAG